ncbi:MAG: hypothetical protein RI897_32 [Verrucomicrobiota bacterium]|jgi:hypothetical protein
MRHFRHSPAALLQVESHHGGVAPAGDVGCGPDRFELLRELVEGLDALEVRLDRGMILPGAIRRGYLTPDEESQVRQMLLSYRNLRLVAYDLILENSNYAGRETESCRYRSFLVAFVAALVLYAKSLRVIQLVEHAPLLRSKLNEPEPRLDIEAGFFDDVLRGYSSLSHYRLMREADRYWRKGRRRMIRLGFAADSQLAWAMGLVRRQRRIVRNRLMHVLWQRLRHDWREFRETVLRPARKAAYGLQSIIGETFAQARLKYDYKPGITELVLEELRGQVCPGDILLVRTEGKVTTALLPGFWAHAAIALGTEEQREGLEFSEGMRERLVVGGRFGHVLEGLAPRVQINPLEQCLAADHVLVLRPNVSPESRQDALREALGHFGLPYDFEFDFTLSTRVVCTGLVYRSFHGRGPVRFELIRRLGRYTLTGDDLAYQALDGWNAAVDPADAPFHFVALALHRRRGGVRFVPPERIPAVLGRIRRGWRPWRG